MRKTIRIIIGAIVIFSILVLLGITDGYAAPSPTTDKILDPKDIIEIELIPMLDENHTMLKYMAAELNLSNGDPFTRDYGERYMFRVLRNADWVKENLDALESDTDKLLDEVTRLLLGPWRNNGTTTFTYSSRPMGCKMLDYETGAWRTTTTKRETIRIEHVTEYTNDTHVVHIDLWDFNIIRK